MTDHPEPLPPAQPATTTGIARDMHQLEDLENRLPQEPDDAEPAAAKEPLFSKKVMILWAAGALAVWMFFNFIGPIIRDSIRASVVESLEEPGSNTAAKQVDGSMTDAPPWAAKQVIRTRNGTTITLTEKGVTILRDVPGAAPVVVPTPQLPKAPAEVPAPAPQSSGKK